MEGGDRGEHQRFAIALAKQAWRARDDLRLVSHHGRDGLVFDLDDKPWGPNYLRFGLDLSTDFQGESTFALLPPCADPGFDHRSCDYWEDADRGSKATRLAWSALFPLVVILGCFLHGWLRLRRRRADLAPWTRIPLFVAGVAPGNIFTGSPRNGSVRLSRSICVK